MVGEHELHLRTRFKRNWDYLVSNTNPVSVGRALPKLLVLIPLFRWRRVEDDLRIL